MMLFSRSVTDLSVRSAACAAIVLILGAVFTAPAHAVPNIDDIPWGHAYHLQGTNGIVNPEVLVGFNPQPDPPGSDPSRIADFLLTDPTTAQFTLPGQTGAQRFQFFFAVGLAGVALTVQDPEVPLGDFGSLTIAVETDVAGAPPAHILDVDLGFETSSMGLVDLASLVGFNPQPDPPGAFGAAGSFAASFTFTILSDAIVTLRLRDATGTTLQLSQVPEPGTMALFVIGLAGLGYACRRKAA